jgi:hypothetical protein
VNSQGCFQGNQHREQIFPTLLVSPCALQLLVELLSNVLMHSAELVHVDESDKGAGAIQLDRCHFRREPELV